MLDRNAPTTPIRFAASKALDRIPMMAGLLASSQEERQMALEKCLEQVSILDHLVDPFIQAMAENARVRSLDPHFLTEREANLRESLAILRNSIHQIGSAPPLAERCSCGEALETQPFCLSCTFIGWEDQKCQACLEPVQQVTWCPDCFHGLRVPILNLKDMDHFGVCFI